jgi:hypothetical protein
MKPNLWMYYDLPQQNHISASLIVFGAEVLKTAKIIRELNILKQIKLELDVRQINPPNPKIFEFSFDYLIDCVKILIFFENYMKAELILNSFCVHKINKDIAGFKDLAKEQFKRPISLKEIHNVEPFEIIEKEEKLYHTAIQEITIGVNQMLVSKEYLKFFTFDSDILEYIKELNKIRNKLHFHGSIEFSVSNKFINQIEKINAFVDKTINERIRKI